MSDTLEDFWAEVLSGEPARVRSAMQDLSANERRNVVAHLRRMVSGSEWSEGQRVRARAALDSLDIGDSLDG
jgi:hypothetical protein